MTWPAFPIATSANAQAEMTTIAVQQGIRVGGLDPISQLQLIATNLLSQSPPVSGNGIFVVTDPQFAGGAKGDGVADDTAAIKAAVSAASAAGGGIVWIPPTSSVYKIIPATTGTDEGGTIKYAFPLLSNVAVWGYGATVKMADGISSALAPVRMSFFFSSDVTSGWSVRGLTMDMNGANNPLPVDNARNQAHIEVSGTPGGIAARASDVVIEDSQFLHTPGTNCLVMAQSNTVGVTLGSGWRVKNCLFKDNGLYVTDFTAVYAWADDVICEDCLFVQEDPTLAGFGCPYEIHGANQRVVHNEVRSMNKAAWVSSNFSTPVTGTVIAGNTWTDIKSVGVEFDRSSASQTAITDVLVAINTLTLNDASAGLQKTFCIIAPKYAITDVLLIGNIAKKTGTNENSAFCAIAPAAGAVSQTDLIHLVGNEATGFVSGVSIVSSEAVGVGRLIVKTNTFNDLADAGGSSAVGLSVNATVGAVANLDLSGNRVNGAKYGTFLAGAIILLNYQGNSYSNITTANYDESTATITNRTGDYDDISYAVTLGNVTLGDGSKSATWTMRGNQVTVRAILTWGSTTSASGTITFSLPFTVSNTAVNYAGVWYAVDSSSGNLYGGTSEAGAGGTTAFGIVNAAGGVNATSPVTFATNDTIAIQLTYTRA